MPYSVSHISIDLRQSIVLFLAIFCLSGYYFGKKYATLFIGLTSILTACLFNVSVNYQTLTSKRMIVFAGQKNTHVSFINRNQNSVFTTDSIEAQKIAKTFWQNQKLLKPEYLSKSDGFFEFEGQKILIMTNDFLKNKTAEKPLEIDYLIIGNSLKPKINQILECVSPHKIIVDKNISKWYTDNIKQTSIARKISFYSVAEHGAYVLNIKD